MHIDQALLGKRLKDARANCGLTQEEVALELGIPRTAVVHIESGSRAVSTLELASFAQLYHRPIADFFREAVSGEEDVLTVLGRISSEFQDNPRVHREVESHIQLCQHGASLRTMLQFDALAAPPAYTLPAPASIWDAVQQGQAVAKDERCRLGLGDNPISDVAELITTEGVWASGTHLPKEMSGMFLRHSSMGMVILVNYDHLRARKRFSYAHEYAHALMDRSTTVTVSRFSDRDQLSEVRANAFAAAFLMPESGVHGFMSHRNKCLGSREAIPVYDTATEELGMKVQALWRSVPGSQHVNYQLVARLAFHFSVSYQAACYRLRSLKCINEADLKELLAKDNQAFQFLDLLKMKDDSEEKDRESDKKPDRELAMELLSLALEAFDRELISKTKLVELGQLLDIDRKNMLELARA